MSQISAGMATERCLCVVRRTAEDRVLLTCDAAAALPSLQAPRIWFPAAVEHVAAAARSSFSRPVHVLRLLVEGEIRLWELEDCSPDPTPPRGFRWTNRRELLSATATDPAHRRALDVLLQESEPTTPWTDRAPWQRPGWLAEARAWIARRGGDLGIDRDAWPVPVRGAWPGSCVLRVPAAGRGWYFKAAQASSLEWHLQRTLTPDLSRHLPEVVEYDEERGWLLMRELDRVAPQQLTWDDLSSALTVLARMQIEVLDSGSATPPSDLPRWSLDGLKRDFRAALGDATALGAAAMQGLDLANATFLHRWTEAVDRLASYSAPYTLIHADFHPGNLGHREGRIVLFDWSEAAFGHPFFSATRLFDYLAEDDDAAAEVPGLIAAYLSSWQARLGQTELRTAFELARRLHPARQVVRWHRAWRTSSSGSPWRSVVEEQFALALARALQADS